jgi:hypothetical protein
MAGSVEEMRLSSGEAAGVEAAEGLPFVANMEAANEGGRAGRQLS